MALLELSSVKPTEEDQQELDHFRNSVLIPRLVSVLQWFPEKTLHNKEKVRIIIEGLYDKNPDTFLKLLANLYPELSKATSLTDKLVELNDIFNQRGEFHEFTNDEDQKRYSQKPLCYTWSYLRACLSICKETVNAFYGKPPVLSLVNKEQLTLLLTATTQKCLVKDTTAYVPDKYLYMYLRMYKRCLGHPVIKDTDSRERYDLSDTDMRQFKFNGLGSIHQRCNFEGLTIKQDNNDRLCFHADFTGSNFRNTKFVGDRICCKTSTFSDCDFTDADITGLLVHNMSLTVWTNANFTNTVATIKKKKLVGLDIIKYLDKQNHDVTGAHSDGTVYDPVKAVIKDSSIKDSTWTNLQKVMESEGVPSDTIGNMKETFYK